MSVGLPRTGVRDSRSAVTRLRPVEIPIKGMDCAECARHVQQAIAELPGVESVTILLAAEKAVIRLDPDQVDLSAIRKAVAAVGDYSVPEVSEILPPARPTGDLSRRPFGLLGMVFVGVLTAVIAGEWSGLFRAINELVPLPVGIALVGHPGELYAAAAGRAIGPQSPSGDVGEP